MALEKVQKRIHYTIHEYETLSRVSEENTAEAGVNFEVVDDPNQLFNLLIDPTLRSKYHQRLIVFMMGYEEKLEAMESVLGQLRDFFVETQAGGTEDLLEEVAGEELDLEEATRELDGAMSKAQSAMKKLVGIKKEMNHLMSIVAAYPDTNKGRKKMEMALLKAQEEVETLSKSLEEVQVGLRQSTEKSSQLQVQLDAKTKDCAELRKTADQVKLLQVGNEKLKRDLASSEKALAESQEQLKEVKAQKSKAQPTETSQADKKRLAELERAVQEERERRQGLEAELETLVQTHGEELAALKAEHEAESSDMRGRFEDQLKSLMEEDVFGEDGETEVVHL